MASSCPEKQSLPPQSTPVTKSLSQGAILQAPTTHRGASDGISRGPETSTVKKTPLRSQKEKGTIEDRFEVYCYLPKRRERLGCYQSRPIPSKVDCFRNKGPKEASQN